MNPHQPVLLAETLELLAPAKGATLVDGTLGAGGHAEALLEAVGPEGRVYGIDRDEMALEWARRRLARFGDAFQAVRGNHYDLQPLLAERGVFAVDGILLDLGVSSMQLDDPERGFSFMKDGPLDMRMDPSTGETAAEWLARASRDEIFHALRTHGEEKQASAIARAIVRERERQPLVRTRQLAELVEHTLGPRARRFRIHPATRTFQALRIVVNLELEGIEPMIRAAVSLLRRGGRLAVIAYHSLEDRPTKQTFHELAHRCTCPPRLPVCGCGRENLVRQVTGKPVRPSEEEIAANPRARSARLRVVERT